MTDPCFACTLPDCDETSPRCALRRAVNRYQRCLDHGEVPTPELKRARGLWSDLCRVNYQANQSEITNASRAATAALPPGPPAGRPDRPARSSLAGELHPCVAGQAGEAGASPRTHGAADAATERRP